MTDHTNMPTCKKCKKELPDSEFNNNNNCEGHERQRKLFDQGVNKRKIKIVRCKTCRKKTQDRENARKKECAEYYKLLRSQTPCGLCGLIDADCLYFFRKDKSSKTKLLSDSNSWATHGVQALQQAVKEFEATCVYCNAVNKHYEKNAFDLWLDNKIKERGTDCDCGNMLTSETIGGFQFCHWHAAEKNADMSNLRNLVTNGEKTVEQAKEIARNEWEKGRIMCKNCHTREKMLKNTVNYIMNTVSENYGK